MTKESAALSNWADMLEDKIENNPGSPVMSIDEAKILVQNLRFVAGKIEEVYATHMDGYK